MSAVPDIDVESGKARLAKAPSADTVLVCRKCARNVRKALKAALKSRRWGKLRVVETGSFELWPQVLSGAGERAHP